MPLHDLKKTIEYAVLNKAGRIVFQTNTLDMAIARRDKMHPDWTVIQLTITYKKMG